MEPGWWTTRSGLRVLAAGVTILLISLVLLLLFAIVIPLLFPPPGGGNFGQGGLIGDLGKFVVVLFVLAVIVTLILWIVGLSMCCAVPGEAGGKGLAIGSLICSVFGTVLLSAAFFAMVTLGVDPFAVPGLQERAAGVGMLVLASEVVAVAASVLFILFLRSVAVSFRNEYLAANILVFLIVFGIYVVGSVAGFFVLRRGFPLGPGGNLGQWVTIVRIIVITMVVVFLLLLAWFIHLLSATGRTIPKHGGGRRVPHYADEAY
jgi:hypothetical protein